MTDIVEQIRAWAPLIESGYEVPAAGRTMREAADEIERLREKIRKLEERNSELSWTVYPDRMGR
jgi:polyhydroxyalkanoate synthesis regulator phasin